MSVSKLLLAVERLGPAAGALIGVAAFFLVANPHIVDPTNIAWLQGGDPGTHYLTWATYRFGPWTLPPGDNPAYGLELATSVLFNDAIPLLAVTLKPFRAFLSEPFQYFGLWVLACFVLQGIFAWKIGEVLGLPLIPRALLTCLLALAPPFLWRLGWHLALCGQWLVLAALYLYLRPAPTTIAYAWVGLLAISSMIQPYIFAMVGAVWLADLVKRRWLDEVTWRNLLYEVGLAIGVVMICLWTAGFVVSSSVKAWGFGVFRLDLLGPLNPHGWSRFFSSDFPYRVRLTEDLIYFGLGVLLLVPLTVPALWKGSASPILTKRFVPLLVALVALTVYALSNQIVLAGEPLVTLPLPEWTAVITDTFRSSQRMVWPAYYAVVIGIAWLIVKAYGARAASMLLAVALVVQIADTSAGWPDFQSLYAKAGSTWSTPLKSPFWEKAAERYTKVRSLPVRSIATYWDTIGYYALMHGLQTDSVYFARLNQDGLQTLRAAAAGLLRTAGTDPDTLYILERAALAKTLQKPGDAAVKIDGLWVLAPGGQALAQEAGAGLRTLDAVLRLPAEPVSFGSKDVGPRYLGAGWSEPEEGGTWSDGPTASFVFCTGPKPERDLRLVFQAFGFPAKPGGTQHVTASLGNRTLASFDLHRNDQQFAVVLPADLLDGESCFDLDFHIEQPKSPHALGMSSDDRELGIHLVSLTVSEV